MPVVLAVDYFPRESSSAPLNLDGSIDRQFAFQNKAQAVG